MLVEGKQYKYVTTVGNEIYFHLIRSKANQWYPLAIIDRILVNAEEDLYLQHIKGYEIYGVANNEGCSLIEVNTYFKPKVSPYNYNFSICIFGIREVKITSFIKGFASINFSLECYDENLYNKADTLFKKIEDTLSDEYLRANEINNKNKGYFLSLSAGKCEDTFYFCGDNYKRGFNSFVDEIILKDKIVDNVKITYFESLHGDVVVNIEPLFEIESLDLINFNNNSVSYISVFDRHSVFEKCNKIRKLYLRNLENISDFFGFLKLEEICSYYAYESVFYLARNIKEYFPQYFEKEQCVLDDTKSKVLSIDYKIPMLCLSYNSYHRAYLCCVPNTVKKIETGALFNENFFILTKSKSTALFLYQDEYSIEEINNPYLLERTMPLMHGYFTENLMQSFALYNFGLLKQLKCIGDYSLYYSGAHYDKKRFVINIGEKTEYISNIQFDKLKWAKIHIAKGNKYYKIIDKKLYSIKD